jgi:LysR family glycine cleavage system transcriptional activator
MRLPPFLTLTALEAAARHRSYSRAARELFVTHGAVSQQIRKLEDELGTKLFVRQGNAMAPTATGQRLADQVTAALATLHAGVDDARLAARGPLVISSSAAFASRWLVTRLERLARETDEPDLIVRAEDRVADLTTDGVDIALRFGCGVWPGVEVATLMIERIFPVCSPDFLVRHPIKEPRDLLNVPLLRHVGLPWAIWLTAMGVDEAPRQQGLGFEDTALMLDTAAHGVGVALARSGLAERDLREGRLVRPFVGRGQRRDRQPLRLARRQPETGADPEAARLVPGRDGGVAGVDEERLATTAAFPQGLVGGVAIQSIPDNHCALSEMASRCVAAKPWRRGVARARKAGMNSGRARDALPRLEQGPLSKACLNDGYQDGRRDRRRPDGVGDRACRRPGRL